ESLHVAGRTDLAMKAFAEAESLQRQLYPKCPTLNSFWSAAYGELILDVLKRRNRLGTKQNRDVSSEKKQLSLVRERCRKALEWAKAGLTEQISILVTEGCNRVTIGATYLYEA